MRARLVVFPVRGRNWCFSRSIDRTRTTESASHHAPSTLKHLWGKLSSNAKPFSASNVELIVDFASNKMNKSWTKLETAPEGSFKNKLYGLGLRLLARVKPSEIFLKSITKDVSDVEVMYPSRLNARLVRRRLRHIAMRGAIIHKKYFYGSVALLPLTTAFTVLPLPNIPFFWVLFRTYSHWRALQGSEMLLQLVSDSSQKDGKTENKDVKHIINPWVLQPSKELEELICLENEHDSLKTCAISKICEMYDLNTVDVLKYRDLM